MIPKSEKQKIDRVQTARIQQQKLFGFQNEPAVKTATEFFSPRVGAPMPAGNYRRQVATAKSPQPEEERKRFRSRATPKQNDVTQ